MIIMAAYYCKMILTVSHCIVLWIGYHLLLINTGLLHFREKRFQISHNYTLACQVLDRVSSIRDLGVIFDSKLLFDQHIRMITDRAYQMGILYADLLGNLSYILHNWHSIGLWSGLSLNMVLLFGIHIMKCIKGIWSLWRESFSRWYSID